MLPKWARGRCSLLCSLPWQDSPAQMTPSTRHLPPPSPGFPRIPLASVYLRLLFACYLNNVLPSLNILSGALCSSLTLSSEVTLRIPITLNISGYWIFLNPEIVVQLCRAPDTDMEPIFSHVIKCLNTLPIVQAGNLQISSFSPSDLPMKRA